MYWAYIIRCAHKDAEGKPFYYVGTTTNLDGRLHAARTIQNEVDVRNVETEHVNLVAT